MTDTQHPTTAQQPGLDGPVSDALVKSRRFFTKATVSDDNRAIYREGGRSDWFYRDRWAYDKVVRSTHGVIRTCTRPSGGCSWTRRIRR